MSKIDIVLDCTQVSTEWSCKQYQVEAYLQEVESSEVVEQLVNEIGTESVLEELDIDEIKLFLENNDYKVEGVE